MYFFHNKDLAHIYTAVYYAFSGKNLKGNYGGKS